jgi:hypothetical protein
MNEAMNAAFDLAYNAVGEDAWHDTSCSKIFAMGWQAALSQQPAQPSQTIGKKYGTNELLLNNQESPKCNLTEDQIEQIKSALDKSTKAQPSCEPVAWLHTMDNTQGCPGNSPEKCLTDSSENPFGEAGLDYSETFRVTAAPLYAATPDYEALRAERDRLKQDLADAILLKDSYLQEYRDLESVSEVQLEGLRAENLHLRSERDALKAALKDAIKAADFHSLLPDSGLDKYRELCK